MNSVPTSIPKFVEGVHYERVGKGRWKWRLKTDIVVRFPIPITRGKTIFRCLDRNGKLWVVIGPNTIWIAAGYAWNGSSFSPDLRGVLLASCVHDAVYQFCGCENWPYYLDRAWADDLFHNLSISRLAIFYRIGLAFGSWACWGRSPSDGETVETKHMIDET